MMVWYNWFVVLAFTCLFFDLGIGRAVGGWLLRICGRFLGEVCCCLCRYVWLLFCRWVCIVFLLVTLIVLCIVNFGGLRLHWWFSFSVGLVYVVVCFVLLLVLCYVLLLRCVVVLVFWLGYCWLFSLVCLLRGCCCTVLRVRWVGSILCCFRFVCAICRISWCLPGLFEFAGGFWIDCCCVFEFGLRLCVNSVGIVLLFLDFYGCLDYCVLWIVFVVFSVAD